MKHDCHASFLLSCYFAMPPNQIIRGILSVCCLSVVSFNPCHHMGTFRERDFINIWYVYSTQWSCDLCYVPKKSVASENLLLEHCKHCMAFNEIYRKLNHWVSNISHIFPLLHSVLSVNVVAPLHNLGPMECPVKWLWKSWSIIFSSTGLFELMLYPFVRHPAIRLSVHKQYVVPFSPL